MNRSPELLGELQNRGIKLSVDGDQLRINAPKGALSPELVARIRQEKTALIAMLGHPRTQEPKTPEIQVVPERHGPLETSFSQQRLWFLERMSGPGHAYNLPLSFKVEGRLDPKLLQRCFDEIILRHEILRTRFDEIDGEPFQFIEAPQPAHLGVIDMSGLNPAIGATMEHQLLRETITRPFDLARLPLMRITLIKWTDEAWTLNLCLHHIISDGWSNRLLIRELTLLYKAFALGRDSPLAPLPIQYADFSAWQRARISDGHLEKQLRYWEKKLETIPAALDLPRDHLRPPVQSNRGAMLRFQLDPIQTAALNKLSLASNATLFMTLQAAFVLLLSRYSGQLDVLVGTPVANRHIKALEPLIGFFVNTLVLRTDLSGNPSFLALLEQVRSTALDAYANQETPFDFLVNRLQPERNQSHAPLFQVMLMLQNIGREKVDQLDLDLREIQLDRHVARFDLLLVLQEGSRGLAGAIEYNADIFEGSTIERLSRHFQLLLQAVVDHPEWPIQQFDLLAEPERQLMLRSFNQTESAYPEQTIHQLFAAMVEEKPLATCLIDGCRRDGAEYLSYQDLKSRADRISNHLLALGLNPEAPVGILMPVSFDLVAGILGILGAGGVYVPIDPTLPQERISFLIAETGMNYVLTCEELDLLSLSEVQTIPVPPILLASNQSPSRESEPCFDPDRLAYIMFTSGSSGRPKGVAVTHRNVVRLVRNASYARMDQDQVFLLASSVAFDASTFEIWASLLNGARLVLMAAGDIERIPELVTEQGVTTLWLTAQLFHEMVDQDPAPFASLNQLLAGGDALSPRHIVKFLDAAPQTALINGYGPTECTTFSTTCPLDRNRLAGGTAPIGKPISNAQCYVIAENGSLQPPGIFGELLIGGDGLARGYFGQPGLTAARFVPNPFTPKSRLYRTGDRVRFLVDGTLEFGGRIDRQVKIRGFRIEPGEIEAHLSRYPGINQALIRIMEQKNNEKRILAYLQPDPLDPAAATMDASRLRQYLRKILPGYMIPSSFMFLEQFPTNANGKIDQAALPLPGAATAVLEEYLAPETQTEILMVDLWQELLELERISVGANFFELGGHSLMVGRLVSRIRRILALELPIRAVFQYPVARDLARYIDFINQKGLAHEGHDLVYDEEGLI